VSDRPTDRAATWPLVAAAALAAVAGMVDAICFGHLFDVFPANQSGNVIFFGVAVGEGRIDDLWQPATAMVGFALGAGASAALRRGGRIPGSARALLAVEALMLIVVAVAVGPVTEVDSQLGGVGGAVLLLVLAVAMGVQTEVLQAHAGVSIATTYQTGALTRIAENLAGAGSPDPEARRRVITILALVFATYIGGAALGAFLVSRWGAVLVVPIAVLAVAALTQPWWGERARAAA
jgi:uncharacterized membrane protein YoaK (UPF0700 family)